MCAKSICPLPIGIDSADDEAGLGFLFRALSANGMLFRDAQRWLGLKSWHPMKSNDIRLLAWISGTDPSWLVHRTVLALRGEVHRSFGLLGHRFGPGVVDYLHSAKICPQCVKRKKYYRASWQLRCICCCVEHEWILSEHCPHCGALIRWNRPAIDICSCGAFLTNADASPILPPHVKNWSEWAEERLFHSESNLPAMNYGLPALFNSLSIDGAFRVVLAVGTLPEAHAFQGEVSALAATSTGLVVVVSRGIERLLSLGNQLAEIRALEPVIHSPTLERMRQVAASVADRNCASVLLSYMRSGSRLGLERRGRFQRGQLSLFN